MIFLHGNGGTPYDTSCGMWPTRIQAMAQYFADRGYSTSELWALGYQGNQCDLIDNPTNNSGLAHTNTANVNDLHRFVTAVLAATGATKVDIVAHGSGVTLTREWVRQYGATKRVRRFVAIEGTNGGMIICSPDSSNYWQLAFLGGFTPSSPVCEELGSPKTPFLTLLNKSTGIDPRNTLVIRDGDASFLFKAVRDGGFQAVAAVDSYGNPTDFSLCPRIRNASEVVLSGQGQYDFVQGTAHIGIGNSTQACRPRLGHLPRWEPRGAFDWQCRPRPQRRHRRRRDDGLAGLPDSHHAPGNRSTRARARHPAAPTKARASWRARTGAAAGCSGRRSWVARARTQSSESWPATVASSRSAA